MIAGAAVGCERLEPDKSNAGERTEHKTNQ